MMMVRFVFTLVPYLLASCNAALVCDADNKCSASVDDETILMQSKIQLQQRQATEQDSNQEDQPAVKHPFMVVGLGPQGAGKSGAERTIIAHLLEQGNTKPGAPVSLLIDDLVEKDQVYKDAIHKFLLDKGFSESSTEEDFETFLAGATEADSTFFAGLYQKSRYETGCGGPKGCSPTMRKMTADAFAEGRNGILESTGERGFPVFYFPMGEAQGFTFHASINTLQFCELKKRNEGRFIQSAVAFMKDQSNNAPRLPDLVKLGETVDKITASIFEFMDSPEFEKLASFRVFSNQERDIEELALRKPTGWSKVKKQIIPKYDAAQKQRLQALMDAMKPQAHCSGGASVPDTAD